MDDYRNTTVAELVSRYFGATTLAVPPLRCPKMSFSALRNDHGYPPVSGLAGG